MDIEQKASKRLWEVIWFIKRLLFDQVLFRQSWFIGASVVFLASLITFRLTFIIPIYIFFVGSFIAGVLLINHNTLCPNLLWNHVRLAKTSQESEVVDESCHVCGRLDCGRHRAELSTESFHPWIDLEIPESINSSLESFFDLVLKEYVLSWYNDLSSDEAFTDEIKTNIRFVVSVLLRRLKKIDLPTFISSKVLNLSMRHLHHCLGVLKEDGFNCCTAYGEGGDEGLKRLKRVEQRLLESYKKRLHCAARSRQLEMEYLKALSEELFGILLPSTSLNSKAFHVLMRELLSGVVLLPSIDIISDPDTLNNLLLIYLDNSPALSPPQPHSPLLPILNAYDSKNSVPRNKNLQLRLTTILSDPEQLYPFMQFMKAELSVNVLQFYLVIEEFNRKILTPDLNGDKLLELHLELRKLYDTFFDPSAKDCIRFDSELTAQIKNICEGSAEEVIKLQTTTPLFRAYEHTYDLLEHTYLPLFHQSDIYYTMMCGERVPIKLEKADSLRSLKRGSTSDSLSKLGNKIKGVFKSNAVDGKLVADDVDYDGVEVQASIGTGQTLENVHVSLYNEYTDVVDEIDDGLSYDGLESMDLNLWVVSVPRILLDPSDANKKSVLFHVEVKRLVDDKHGEFEPEEWSIERRYHEFYVLETKLKEFHGVFEDCQLPPKKTFLPKNKSFFEALRPDFESFLRILLTKSTLRGSHLMHSFLTSDQEFTSSILDVNLGKKVKSGAMKFVKERGQHLESFLKSFLSSTELPKSKPCKGSDNDSDTVSISSEKVLNSIYGNNANLPHLSSITDDDDGEMASADNDTGSHDDDSFVNQISSYFDAVLYLCWKLFPSPQWLLQLLWSMRTFAKNSIDCYMDWYVGDRIDEALDEETVVSVVYLLRDALFYDTDPPRTEEDKQKRRELSYQALHNYIPRWFLDTLGRPGSEDGLRLVFNLLQLPRLNKQLAYVLFDTLLMELFPELDSTGTLKKKEI